LVSDSNVSELEITEAEGKVRIVKSVGAPVQAYAPAPVYQQPAPAAPATAAAVEAALPVPPLAEAAASHAVKSPRRRPAPSPSSRWATASKRVRRFASSKP
jgi:acetyl-CoA carboxylase biotin carboxyl carrier protein